MHRNYKGIKKYENLLKTICNVDDFSRLPAKEWEGCIGVACVMAVKEGIVPSLKELSVRLEIPHYDRHFQNAYNRLRGLGILSPQYGLMEDPALNGVAQPTRWRTPDEISLSAWCTIAGFAGGFLAEAKG